MQYLIKTTIINYHWNGVEKLENCFFEKCKTIPTLQFFWGNLIINQNLKSKIVRQKMIRTWFLRKKDYLQTQNTQEITVNKPRKPFSIDKILENKYGWIIKTISRPSIAWSQKQSWQAGQCWGSFWKGILRQKISTPSWLSLSDLLKGPPKDKP